MYKEFINTTGLQIKKWVMSCIYMKEMS